MTDKALLHMQPELKRYTALFFIQSVGIGTISIGILSSKPTLAGWLILAVLWIWELRGLYLCSMAHREVSCLSREKE